ncbi:hypothetical protein K438DRAFT_1749852 [Mycena galopus ATCC 62051]|nr:hypothetical protein K438DRAFT_1749852 [Mycena galopus ATCC 62051]
MPEREKHSPVPPVPSRTPPARRLAQAKYRESIQKIQNLLAFKKQEKRKKANAQKGTKQGYQMEEKRDYALEYALRTHRKQDELQKKVSDTLWRDKDGTSGCASNK